VFTFNSGASITQIVTAVNLVSDATGVQAANNSGVLELESVEYGTDAYVAVEVISEGASGTFETNLSDTRDEGDDIVAIVNGVGANGKGNTMSINTSSLTLEITVDDGSSTDFSFNIEGGGAVFQLGPEVVTNQQARIGVGAVYTGTLGGSAGRLYQLRTGESAALDTDTTTAAEIVNQVITDVVELRGRLGAFQRTTLDANIAALQDTLVNLTSAESAIRDADFARESASLTRAQILVRSGTSVLAIANQNPQQVLTLLQ
jgi:flagellin